MRGLPRYSAATYWFGDVVYLRIREERTRGMITGVNLRPGGVCYGVQWPGEESFHYEFELTTEFVHDFGVERE